MYEDHHPRCFPLILQVHHPIRSFGPLSIDWLNSFDMLSFAYLEQGLLALFIVVSRVGDECTLEDNANLRQPKLWL